MVGGSVVFFIVAGLATTSLVLWGNIQAPIVVSHCYLGLVAVMGYELSRDVLRASKLVHELQVSEAGLRESEARMSLAVETAGFGLWIRDLARDEVWASERWRACSASHRPSAWISTASCNASTPMIASTCSRPSRGPSRGSNGGRYQLEFRLALPDGASGGSRPRAVWSSTPRGSQC